MPRRYRLFVLTVVISVVIALAAPLLRSFASASEERDEVVIRKLLEKQVVDWNRKNLDAFLEAYWHAPGVVFQSGPTRTDGFEAMRKRYQARYQAEGREMGKLSFVGVEVIPLGPDSAFVRGRWELSLSDGKKPGGLFTLILRKVHEGWRIVHDHTSS